MIDFTNYSTKSLTRLATTLRIARPNRPCRSSKLLKVVEAELLIRNCGSNEDDMERARRYGKGDQKLGETK